MKWMLLAALVAACLLTGSAGLAEDAVRDAKLTQWKEPGNIVTFGHYEQDNNLDNGPEEIEWMVLDVQGDDVLLLSKYGLEVKQFNTRYVATTWETCSLRRWMNDEFLNTAFTEEEQSSILLTDVDNSPSQGHPRYQANSGNNTQDRIFALSWAEANRYLNVTYEDGNNVGARVAPTPYAKARGAWTKREYQTAEQLDGGRGWLRSPGRHPNRTSYVCHPGWVRDNQTTAGSPLFGYILARPALWVRLGS